MKDSDAMYVTCPVAKGSGTFMMKVSKNYNAIATDLGFTIAENVAEASGKLVSVNEAVKRGDCIKIRISIKGTTTKPSRSTKIIVSTKKVADAFNSLTGKMYGTVITGARPIRNLRYS